MILKRKEQGRMIGVRRGAPYRQFLKIDYENSVISIGVVSGNNAQLAQLGRASVL